MKGFSRTEIIILLVGLPILIWALVGMMPCSVGNFQDRAKQEEAKSNLMEIRSLENRYRDANRSYLACPLNPPTPGAPWDQQAPGWRELGFQPKDRKYYAYDVLVQGDHVVVRAFGNLDGDATIDVWQVGDEDVLNNIVNDLGE